VEIMSSKKYSMSNSFGSRSPNEVKTEIKASSMGHQTSAEDKPRRRSTFSLSRHSESSQVSGGFLFRKA